MKSNAFITSKGTVGYVLQANKSTIDSIATMSKAQAVVTLSQIFKENEDKMPKNYAAQVLANAQKKRSAQEILIYLYNILLAQNNCKVIQTTKGV